MTTPDNYVHGHHESVLRSHTWRSVENSAAYLAPSLEPGLDILDVGCGPGTISVDLGARVGPGGSVVGIDASADVIDKAKNLLVDGAHPNCSFEVADVYQLGFPDDHFDIVHAHQVLQHLTDPVRALREMRRVAKPGGIVAVRDADYGGMTWAPSDPLLTRWLELYHQITSANQVEADAGRFLLGWALEAGLNRVDATSSTWTFATPDLRTWWAELWADRVVHSSYASEARAHRLSDDDELEAIAAAWRRWCEQPDAFFVCPHAELVATVD